MGRDTSIRGEREEVVEEISRKEGERERVYEKPDKGVYDRESACYRRNWRASSFRVFLL